MESPQHRASGREGAHLPPPCDHSEGHSGVVEDPSRGSTGETQGRSGAGEGACGAARLACARERGAAAILIAKPNNAVRRPCRDVVSGAAQDAVEVLLPKRSTSKPWRKPRSLTAREPFWSLSMTVRTMQAPARMTSARFGCRPTICRRASVERELYSSICRSTSARDSR